MPRVRHALLFAARLVHLAWLIAAALRDALVSRDYASLLRSFGFGLPPGGPSLWIHGEGLGEFLAAEPLFRRLRSACPGHRLVLSASSAPTRRWLSGRHPDAVVLPMPRDIATAAFRWFARLDPRLILLLEFGDGFCPAILELASRRGVGAAVVNGRRLRPPRPLRYALADLLGLVRYVESLVRCVCVQDTATREGLLAGGLPEERVVVTGPLKFDREPPPREERFAGAVRQQLGSSENTPVLVVSCLHQEEETIVLALYQRLRCRVGELRLVLAPADPGRVPALARSLTRLGLSHGLRSNHTRGDVLLLDTLGELPALLEVATVVLLGGSLTPGGAGHSPVEAALQGKPVVVGPYTPSQEEVLRLFRDGGAIRQVQPEQLEESLFSLLTSPSQARALGEAARAVVARNVGATERTMTALAPLLPGAPGRDSPTPLRWWKRPLFAAANSPSGQALLRRCVRRLDTWQEVREQLGDPRTIACLGNGPSSEDPRLAGLAYDCLFRVNWRWLRRGRHTRPAVIFTGDDRTFEHCYDGLIAFRTIEEETRILCRVLTRPRHWGRGCFTLERLGSFLTRTAWPARPTNGAAMVAAAVALRPARLILAGIDLYWHHDGAYPDGPLMPNAYAPMHDRAVELAILRRALAEFDGEVIVLGEPLREALAA
jgi:3-deoxy-D-manno-octulosonic-acid transferase